MIENSQHAYGSFSKTLHWLMAVMVITLLVLGFLLHDIPRALRPEFYAIHKSLGLTVLCLLFIRILWHLYSRPPALEKEISRPEKWLARTVQISFYCVIFLQCVSGWVMSVASRHAPYFWGLFPATLPIDPNRRLAHLNDQLHSILGWIILGLVCLHVLGALKHHWLNKDNTLNRMILRF